MNPPLVERSKQKVNTELIAGIDEAGRGPLAGPVTAACVVLRPGYENPSITDSKKLSSKQRENLFPEICKNALAYSVVSVGPRRIESLNIREATKQAMSLASKRVFKQLHQNMLEETPLSLRLLIDGNMEIETTLPQETIIKGDAKVLEIGAASILAKVTRDKLMARLDFFYPGYGLAGHKGYPTKKHRGLIAEKGPSRIHRRTFAGVREFLECRQKILDIKGSK